MKTSIKHKAGYYDIGIREENKVAPRRDSSFGVLPFLFIGGYL